MDNKSKVDRLHDLLPKYLNTQNNTNWKGLIEAIGEEDQKLAELISQVREQFFVKTASRPYLDTLGSNNSVSRPRLVGMTDDSYREYITVMSYQPKQVKLIIDLLLDVFFSKDSTTAFLTSNLYEPFTLQDGWELELLVDGQFNESVVFTASDFTSISAALAEEIAASYNRQAKYSYATAYYDSITKNSYIKIFTSTIGAKGSLQVVGGRANIGLQLNGFIIGAGNGINTQWTITKVGDTVTYTHTGGASPNIDQLQVGDVIISNIAGNEGSFEIKSIDLAGNSITILNLLATVGVYTQTSAEDTKFFRPDKYTAYKLPKRAMTWETVPGEVTVEMPTTPPVVKRSLKGGWHLNGDASLMTTRNSATSLTVADASGFPASGSFIIEPINAITHRILTEDTNEVVKDTQNGRLIHDVQKYTYSSRVVLSTTGSVTTGSSQITVASVAGISNGMTIFMDGFRTDAVVTNIVGLVVTSSIPATQTLSGATIEFGGNTLTGISPNLPDYSAINEFVLTAVTRTSNTVTCTTSATHNYAVKDLVNIVGNSGINVRATIGNTTNSSDTLTALGSTVNVAIGQLIFGVGIPSNTKVAQILSPTSVKMTKNATATATGVSIDFNEDLNGGFIIQSTSPNQFTYNLLGTNGSVTAPGTSSTEEIKMSDTGSKIIVTKSISSEDTRIKGSYLWDLAASYVLSANTATVSDNIIAGKMLKLINIGPNTITDQSGFVIFDYGQDTQEGPVRYLYKPTETILAIDPSYIFKKSHSVGSSIVEISHKGPHTPDTLGGEYAPYITDPAIARITLENLIKSVASAGIFVNFLIRYPKQLYAFLDVYNSN